MKINKLFTGFIALASLFLAACSSDDDYSWDKVSGAQVYFSNSLPSKVDLNKDETSFSFPLNRINTEEELTVKLTLTDETGKFSIPSEVKFIEGQAKANITVTYDASEFENDDYKDVKISIAGSEYTTPYGMSTYAFSAGIPAPFKSLGKATLDDNYLEVEGAEVEVLQSIENPNIYRIMQPYTEITEFFVSKGWAAAMGHAADYLDIYVMQPGNTLGGVTVTQNDLVYYDPFTLGMDIFGLGMETGCYHPAAIGRGESAWTHNRVLSWQEDGTPGQIQLAPLYMTEEGRGNDQSVNDGVIVITFPGYNPKDYSVDVNYLGAFVDKSETSYAMANVEMGADVEEVQIGVIEGNNVDAGLNDMLNGAVETVTVKESGEVRVPCNYSGTCTLIAVSYGEGDAQDYGYATFNFALQGSDWKSIGTGLYTDYIFHLNLIDENKNPVPEVTYPVEIQENTKTPGVYRLINPYAPGIYGYRGDFGYDDSQDYNIVIDAHDPDAVFIQMQPLGFPDENDDDMIMFTNGGFFIDNGYDFENVKKAGHIKGKLVDGVITFEKKELMFSYESIIGQGRAGYADEENDTEVLVLPEAVNAAAKAKVNKVRKTMKLKAGKNSTLRRKCNVNTKNIRFQITDKFNVSRAKFNK